jgi:hypothetical protein
MKKAFTLMALVGVGVLIAFLSLVSNTGFKLNHPIAFEPGRLNITPCAVPYFSPLIDGTGDSRTILEDIDGGSGAQGLTIRQFQNPLSTRGAYAVQIFLPPATFLGADYEIEPCTGFEILPQNSATVFNIVGSHDDDDDGCPFTGEAGRLNLFTFGPPYHTTWDTAGDILLSPEVCQDSVGLTIRNFDNSLGTRGAYQVLIALPAADCTTATLLGTDYDLVPGAMYEILPSDASYAANPIAPHY